MTPRPRWLMLSWIGIVILVACGRRDDPPRCGADCVNATAAAFAATSAAQLGGVGSEAAGTAQALLATAQAPFNQTANQIATLAGVAGEAGATAQAIQATLQAVSTENQPTAQAIASQAAAFAATAHAGLVTLTPPPIVGQAEAAMFVTEYSHQVLGFPIEVTYAGGLTTEVDQHLALPQAGEAAQLQASQLAVRTYAALWPGGAGSVSYGSGTVAGDVTLDINSASLGAFSVERAAPVPATETEALAGVLQTFPGLATRTFNPAPAEHGYAWVAEGQVPGFDLQTLQATLITEKVHIGIVPAGTEKSTLFVVIGKGVFAVQVTP
jgi:hypothetical protein